MKKLAAFAVFALFLCFLLPVARAAGADPVGISTPEELAAIADDPHGSYVLTADIDMKGVDWAPVEFYGRLDGGGHTIYNLSVTKLGAAHAATVDGNAKRYDTVFAGLFSVVRNAEIKDLNLLNVDVRVSTGENCFAAGLAGFAEDTAITGCSVRGRVYLYNTNHMCGVAGFVGFGRGTVTGSTADVELVFVDGDRKIKCEEFLGGILGTGYTDIENCTVKLKGYASVQGYVHNGGIVGMYYVYAPKDKAHKGYVRGNSVNADIYFYENNRDRRAYCKAAVGEKLNRFVRIAGNTVVHFKNGETKNYKKILLPEKDSEPAYSAAVTAPACTAFGYTTYTCAKCGYAYTDDYTAPAHTPGEWVRVKEPTAAEAGAERLSCAACGKVLEEREVPVLHTHTAGDWAVVKEPTYDENGLKRQTCKDCGETLNEEEIPKLSRASSCTLDSRELSLSYKASAALHASLLPEEAVDKGLVWTSSDENVAKVDDQGNVYAAGRGTAVIMCASADGGAKGECTVTVSYTFWQWVIVIVLFGWIWY